MQSLTALRRIKLSLPWSTFQHHQQKLATFSTSSQSVENVVIIGSGPAGYCAGLYAARANLKPLLFQGRMQPGGQLTTTTAVENYLGLDEENGFELTERFRKHAEKYGTRMEPNEVIRIDTKQSPFRVFTQDNKEYLTRSIILACGASARRLDLPSEPRLWNNGISACAVCDGALPLFRNKPLAVVGGGDTAMEEATFLTKFASKVYVIHRSQKFRASPIMLQRARSNPKIEFIMDTVLVDATGDDIVNGVIIKNLKDQSEKKLAVSGLFYSIGHVPNTSFLKGSGVDCDSSGYVITKPGTTHTSVPGVFAAGDVQDKKYRQAITSAGTGCMAALEANEWLSHHYS